MSKFRQLSKNQILLMVFVLFCFAVTCYVFSGKTYTQEEQIEIKQKIITCDNIKSLSIKRSEAHPYTYLEVNMNEEYFSVHYSESSLTKKAIDYRIKTSELKANQNDFFYHLKNLDYSIILINAINDMDFFNMPVGIGRWRPNYSDRKYTIESFDGKKTKVKTININCFYMTENTSKDRNAMKILYFDSILEKMLVDLFGPNYKSRFPKETLY